MLPGRRGGSVGVWVRLGLTPGFGLDSPLTRNLVNRAHVCVCACVCFEQNHNSHCTHAGLRTLCTPLICVSAFPFVVYRVEGFGLTLLL